MPQWLGLIEKTIFIPICQKIIRSVSLTIRYAREVRSGTLSPEAVSEETISRHLYTADVPDPDLLIRTSGEMRISNYLLWQISYSELWITKKAWPEFDKEDLVQAIRDYNQRDRRFGGLR